MLAAAGFITGEALIGSGSRFPVRDTFIERNAVALLRHLRWMPVVLAAPTRQNCHDGTGARCGSSLVIVATVMFMLYKLACDRGVAHTHRPGRATARRVMDRYLNSSVTPMSGLPVPETGNSAERVRFLAARCRGRPIANHGQGSADNVVPSPRGLHDGSDPQRARRNTCPAVIHWHAEVIAMRVHADRQRVRDGLTCRAMALRFRSGCAQASGDIVEVRVDGHACGRRSRQVLAPNGTLPLYCVQVSVRCTRAVHCPTASLPASCGYAARRTLAMTSRRRTARFTLASRLERHGIPSCPSSASGAVRSSSTVPQCATRRCRRPTTRCESAET